MSDRFFIEEQSLVKKKLLVLKPLGETSGYECELYLDSKTGNKWEKYLFEFEESGEDGIGIRRFPYPDTEKIINIALTSRYPDEVEGAAALLVDREYNKIEFREKLITAIEKNINAISKSRYELIYHRAELNDIINKREIVGKHYTEIEKDAKHYLQMMERAEKLKARITSANI